MHLILLPEILQTIYPQEIVSVILMSLIQFYLVNKPC